MRAFAFIGYAAFLSGALPAQSSDVKAKFATIEIHASGPNTVPRMRSIFSGGRYELGNATAADLIATAWDVDTDAVAGGPDWLDADRFDVIATAPSGSTPEMLRIMLRALLDDRFHLVAHEDKRTRPVYAMTVAKTVRLKQSGGTEETGCRTPQFRDPILFECRNLTMAAFIDGLPRMPGASAYLFNYRVVDQTRLKGVWDFNVKWSMPNPAVPRQALRNNITLFDALEKQLGLKLVRTKVSTAAIVVDSVRKPTVDVTESGSSKPVAFEVASIKPADPETRGGNVAIERGGRVSITMTLKDLVWEAWGNLNTERIVGGPSFMDTTIWVVVAKAPAKDDGPAGWVGPVWNGVDLNTMRMMLRALLVDRFKLSVHMEDRQVAGYALVVAKPKLRKADSSNRPGCRNGPGIDGKDPRIANPVASTLVTCRNMTLAQFAGALSKPTGEENPIVFNFPPVVDETGIEGRFDLTLNFTPARVLRAVGTPAPDGTAAASEPDGTITIFEALRHQLGLKLESRKVTVSVLVIDHVDERPSAN